MSDIILYRHKKSFISIWGAGITSVVLFNFVNQNDFMRSKTGDSNLVQYAIMCVVFLLVYLAANGLLRLRLFNQELFINILCGISCFSIAVFMYICWKQDVEVYNSPADTYLWHMYPPYIIFAVLIMITLLYEAVAVNVNMAGKKTRHCIWVYYILVILLGGFLNYFPEYLNVDYFHGSAVFNSVYNVMHGIPYEETSNSVYGNYALLLAIPMKIIGNGEYFDLSTIMSFLTMVCIALAIYVIHNVIERKDIRILCVTALLWVYIFKKTNYWQLNPMRFVWPLVLIAWMVFLNKKDGCSESTYKYIFHAVTYLILVFSILWNKESGIVCLIGYLVFVVSKGLSLCLKKDGRKIWGTILECLIMMTSIFAAFMVVGVYNLIVAGRWISIRVFLFPLFTGNYVESLVLGLQAGIWPWMAVTFLFLGVAGRLGIRILRREEIDPKEYVYASAAVIGLGLMTYFMNRAAYMNMTICYYEAVICIGGVICSMNREDYGLAVSTFMRTGLTMVLVALVAGEMLHLGTSLYDRQGFDKQEILELRDKIQEDAEVDTYAFGINIPELYSLLGWETRSYTTDWADVFITRDVILEKLYSDLENEESIITDMKTFERYQDVEEYVKNLFYVEKVYPYNENVKFFLMKKKK